jgi:uncharacterized protein (DUF58 family)
MAYGDSTLSKFDYARQLAAALGYLLLSQQDGVGLIAFDTKVRERFEPGTSPQKFQQLTAALEKCKPGAETSLGEVISETLPTIPRRSLIFVISDCFDKVEAKTLRRAIPGILRSPAETVQRHGHRPAENDHRRSVSESARSVPGR